MRRHNVGDWPYNPALLAFYDFAVLNISTRCIWECPLPILQSLYDKYTGVKHLEIGVGTGYLLDHCQCINNDYSITLLDLNSAPLQRTRRRLQRYRTQACLADILDPLPFKKHSFQSVGMNFVLHCLPGDHKKLNVFRNIRSVMASDAVLFGSTVLAIAGDDNIFARNLMRLYNRSKAFHNESDTAERFINALNESFSKVETETIGGVLKFVARTAPNHRL